MSAPKVIQADRGALLASAHPLSRESREEIALGRWDHHHLVVAFARHRERYTIIGRAKRLWKWLT